MATLFSALNTHTPKEKDTFDWDAFKDEVDCVKKSCERCKDIDWQDQEEIIVCKACGVVVERPLDMGPE